MFLIHKKKNRLNLGEESFVWELDTGCTVCFDSLNRTNTKVIRLGIRLHWLHYVFDALKLWLEYFTWLTDNSKNLSICTHFNLRFSHGKPHADISPSHPAVCHSHYITCKTSPDTVRHYESEFFFFSSSVLLCKSLLKFEDPVDAPLERMDLWQRHCGMLPPL